MYNTIDGVRGFIYHHDQINKMKEVAKDKQLGLEIGSWCGLSASLMAPQMAADGMLYCIDTFDCTNMGTDEYWYTLNEFNDNATRLGYANKVTPIRGNYDSDFMLSNVPDNLDFIFFDAMIRKTQP